MMKAEVPQEDMGQGEVLGNGRLIAECFCDGMPLSPPPRWCGPCKILGPRLEKVVAKQHGKVVMAKVDIDDHTDLAIEYEVRVSRACRRAAAVGCLGVTGQRELSPSSKGRSWLFPGDLSSSEHFVGVTPLTL